MLRDVAHGQRTLREEEKGSPSLWRLQAFLGEYEGRKRKTLRGAWGVPVVSCDFLRVRGGWRCKQVFRGPSDHEGGKGGKKWTAASTEDTETKRGRGGFSWEDQKRGVCKKKIGS